MVAAASDLRWSVDSLVQRAGNLFSHGWCAHEGRTIASLELVVHYPDGGVEALSCQFGVTRTDVVQAFPGLSAACGYWVHRKLSRGSPASTAQLRVHYVDGTHHELPVVAFRPLVNEIQPNVSSRGISIRMLRRAWGMLVRGDWRSLRAGLARRVGVWSAASVLPEELRAALTDLPSGAVLMVDHSLGGGANQFRRDRVTQHLAAGQDVLVWSFVPSRLRYHLAWHKHTGPGALPREWHLDEDAWEWLTATGRIAVLEFNNCVSFPQQEDWPQKLLQLASAGSVRLRVFLHDYHMVCPSHFLLDFQGRFCGVPDLDTCRQCLPRIDDPLAGLFGLRDIDLWRKRWGGFLTAADEIVHFSRSSRDLLNRAYPSIRESQWRLRPHPVRVTPQRYPYPGHEPGFRIAVVGHISRAKGSEVVLALVRAARARGQDLSVVVVGTMEDAESVPAVVQTGSYAHEELFSKLCQHRVHMALMPSICAETFSYVTHELIALGVPLASFRIGAQGEAVAAYARGCLLGMGDTEAMLQELHLFKQRLDADELSGNAMPTRAND